MKIIFIFLQTLKSLVSEIIYNIKSNKHFNSEEFQNYLKNNSNMEKNR